MSIQLFTKGLLNMDIKNLTLSELSSIVNEMGYDLSDLEDIEILAACSGTCTKCQNSCQLCQSGCTSNS